MADPRGITGHALQVRRGCCHPATAANCSCHPLRALGLGQRHVRAVGSGSSCPPQCTRWLCMRIASKPDWQAPRQDSARTAPTTPAPFQRSPSTRPTMLGVVCSCPTAVAVSCRAGRSRRAKPGIECPGRSGRCLQRPLAVAVQLGEGCGRSRRGSFVEANRFARSRAPHRRDGVEARSIRRRPGRLAARASSRPPTVASASGRNVALIVGVVGPPPTQCPDACRTRLR